MDPENGLSFRLEIRKLRKKLRQIEVLERLERDLNEEEARKVSRKDDIRSDLQRKLQQCGEGASSVLDTDNSSSFLTTTTTATASSLSNVSTGQETSFGSCIDEKEAEPAEAINIEGQGQGQELEVKDIQSSCESRGKKEEDSVVEKGSGGKSLGCEDQNSGASVHLEVSTTAKEKSKKKRSGKKRVLGNADVLRSGKFAVQTLKGHNDVILTLDCTGSVLVTGRQVYTSTSIKMGSSSLIKLIN
jgi:hypothetical protein